MSLSLTRQINGLDNPQEDETSIVFVERIAGNLREFSQMVRVSITANIYRSSLMSRKDALREIAKWPAERVTDIQARNTVGVDDGPVLEVNIWANDPQHCFSMRPGRLDEGEPFGYDRYYHR